MGRYVVRDDMENSGEKEILKNNMVKVIHEGNKELYRCEECGFHYEDRQMAETCEAWCREHHTCNIEITAHAQENKA
ncbi:MAG: hypothetical protein U1A23_03970 [Candidatus Sungbacteria bacterium]|nr:hypothetical protein [Candidatus Sungbacteria bacterium]